MYQGVNGTTQNNTNLIGANLLAQNVNLEIGGNLLLKSRQNLSESDSYNIGMNLGISGNSGGVGGGSVGFNLGNGYSNRAWVDQVSSIIGTNSVNINVGTKDDNNNYTSQTGNTNLVGAVIANKDKDGVDLGNLTLNTKTLTFENLKNHNNSESSSLGLSAQFGNKPNNPAMPDQLNLDLSLQGSKASSATKATIGNGAINIGISSATKEQTANPQTTGLNRDISNTEQNQKTVITSDFNATIKVPTMILTNPTEFKNQAKEGYDVLTSEEAKDIYGKVWASPNTAIGLTIGGVGYLYGAATGQEVKVSIGNNAVQFEGNPLGLGDSAVTLGNTINYFGIGAPESIWNSYDRQYKIKLGEHEQAHTYQYQQLGPLFLPAYLIGGGVQKSNPFERSADEVSRVK